MDLQLYTIETCYIRKNRNLDFNGRCPWPNVAIGVAVKMDLHLFLKKKDY